MGDRCVIIITNKFDEISPCACYLHWNGSEALNWIKDAIPRMRKDDVGYSMARLIGCMHEKIGGNVSLGVISPPDSLCPIKLKECDYSHGDAGIVIYNCSTGDIICYHGYLEGSNYDRNIGFPASYDYY